MNAIDFLLDQHRDMEARLERVGSALESEQRPLFIDVADRLTLHMAAEEEVFYPAVKARRTEDVLLESLEEHLSLKRLLADLLALKPSDQTFGPKFKVLKEQTEHHHEEEEEHLFPKVAKLIDSAELEALGRGMQELQERLSREGRPRERVRGETEAAAPLR
jgi:hemerythrin superfamily protein